MIYGVGFELWCLNLFVLELDHIAGIHQQKE
jgi:hypothetical protein